MTDPLNRILVSGEDLDRAMLATVLVGLVQIDKVSGDVRFSARSAKLTKKMQILLLLLGRKAAKAMGLIDTEATGPKEMEPVLGLKGGPLRGQLFQLKKERLVQAVKGKYLIPNYAIEAVKELLSGSD